MVQVTFFAHCIRNSLSTRWIMLSLAREWQVKDFSVAMVITVFGKVHCDSNCTTLKSNRAPENLWRFKSTMQFMYLTFHFIYNSMILYWQYYLYYFIAVLKFIPMWYDQGECRMSLILIVRYWLKRVTNSYVLHCLEIQRIDHISGTRCWIVMRFGSRCSIING